MLVLDETWDASSLFVGLDLLCRRLGIALGCGILVGVSIAKATSKGGSSSGVSTSISTSNSSGSNNDPSNFARDDRLKQSFYGLSYTPEGSQLPSCGNSLGMLIPCHNYFVNFH